MLPSGRSSPSRQGRTASESGPLRQRLVAGTPESRSASPGWLASVCRVAAGRCGTERRFSKRVRTGRAGFRDRSVRVRRVRGRRLSLGRETPRPFLEQGTFVRSRPGSAGHPAVSEFRSSTAGFGSRAGAVFWRSGVGESAPPEGRFPRHVGLRRSVGRAQGLPTCRSRRPRRSARRFGYWESRIGRVL